MNTSGSTGKEKIGAFFAVLIFAGLIVWCLWSGIKGLFLAETHPLEEVFAAPVQGDAYAGQIGYASNYRKEYSRTINHRWAGVLYYYIIFSEDRSRAVIVRSTKNWGSDFGNDFCNKVSLQASGIARKLPYKVKEKLSRAFANCGEQGIQLESVVYLDLLAKNICRMQLFSGISLLLITIYFRLLYKNALSENPKPVSKGLAVVMAILVLMTVFALLYLRNKT